MWKDDLTLSGDLIPVQFGEFLTLLAMIVPLRKEEGKR
jgi:hypothetical protein